MNIFQRIKNIWYLGSIPKDGKGYPQEYERGFQAGEMHAVQSKGYRPAIIIDDEAEKAMQTDFPAENNDDDI